MMLRKIYFEAGILIAFAVSRFYNLAVIPIFTDEAIYSYWAQVALHDPSNRYISLEDGKQPLFIWLASAFQAVISDPLIATRSVSIFSGFLTLLGIYLLSRELFGSKVARIAALLYVILPFGLLYDRLALYDSLLTAILTFVVYLSIKLAKKPSLENGLLLGIVSGLGLLTKSSALLFLYLIPVPFVIFNFNKGLLGRNTLRWAGFSFIAFLMAQIIFNSLRLSPLFYLVSRKNYEFIRPLSEFLKDPFSLFVSNLTTLVNWQLSYFGWPLLGFFLAGVIYSQLKRDRKIFLLSIYIFFPFFIKTFFNIRIYPRFMLFYYPLMLIAISYFATAFVQKYHKGTRFVFTVFLLALVFPLLNSFYILTDPPKAKIAGSDRDQYISAWPAGYGVAEVVGLLKQESRTQDIFVGTEGTFGLLPYALKIYFYANPKVQIEGYWPVDHNKLPDAVLEESKRRKSFFVFNENQKEIENHRLKFVNKYKKGDSNSYMRIYEII